MVQPNVGQFVMAKETFCGDWVLGSVVSLCSDVCTIKLTDGSIIDRYYSDVICLNKEK